MVDRHIDDETAVWTLSHGKANALDLDLLDELSDLLEAELGEASRALVLTGSGRIFSAGVDLFRALDGGRTYLERFLPAFDRTLRRLAAFPRPVVAAINGHAVAGGCILACAADYRVMSHAAGTFGLPELSVGVPFPPLALAILKGVWSPAALQEALYRGVVLSAQESVDRGVVDELCVPGEQVAAALRAAKRLASIPPRAFALNKRFLRADVLQTPDDQQAMNALLDVWTSPEVTTSIRAYVERTLGRRAGD